MSTYMYDFLISIEDNWQEVNILISKAKEVKEPDENLYNALCRSITILIVSHMEGFMKNLVKNYIDELNSKFEFKDLTKGVQRTYCLKYIGDENQTDKIEKLIEKFEEYNCNLSHEAFIFDKNKNPNVGIIQSIFKNFGINKVFTRFNKSDILNKVFENSLFRTNEIKETLKNDLKDRLSSFPFNLDEVIDKYELKKENTGSTLWEDFIKDMNQKRHNIVHGNEFSNIDDIHSLELRKEKIIVFQYVLILILSSSIK